MLYSWENTVRQGTTSYVNIRIIYFITNTIKVQSRKYTLVFIYIYLMSHNVMLPYFYLIIFTSRLLLYNAKYFGTLLLHRRSFDAFYI